MNFPFFHHPKPVIRERADHCVSRSNIDPDAVKVLYRLSKAGYTAYLVGGGVRDLLLGRTPKDFDVGTDAKPNEIRRIFRNCFLIGRRFRLAHIIFGKKIIETSTFRRRPDNAAAAGHGLYQAEDNTFGTPEEDAQRRDFTVNGLFYDIRTFTVIDYVGGLKDLEKRVIRSIGDPNIRFQEDPVRMLRAVKFSSRLDFAIERSTKKAVQKNHAHILEAAVPRLCEEILRLFPFRSAQKAFRLMWELRLLADLLPDLSAHIDASGGANAPVWRYLDALDRDPASEDASNAVRLACLYYPLFAQAVEDEKARSGPRGRVNRLPIARAALRDFTQRLRIPKALSYSAIFLLDSARRFADAPASSRGKRFLRNPDFPDALAFRRVVLAAERSDASKLDEWERACRDMREEEAARAAAARGADGPALDAEAAVPGDAAPGDAAPGDDGSAVPARRGRRPRRRRRPASGAAE